MANLSLNFIAKLEQGSNMQNISVNSLILLSTALNVSPSVLLDGSRGPEVKRRKKVDYLSHQLYKLDEDDAERLADAFITVIKSYNNKNKKRVTYLGHSRLVQQATDIVVYWLFLFKI